MTALGQSSGLFAAFSVVSFGGKVLYTLSGLRILVSVIFEILKDYYSHNLHEVDALFYLEEDKFINVWLKFTYSQT